MAYPKKKDKDAAILDIRQLSEKLKAGEDMNLVLLYGAEDFFIDMAIASFKKKYLGEGAETMDFVKLDFGGKDLDPDTVAHNIELPPWLSEKRIVVVTNFTFPSETDAVLEVVAHVPDTTVLIFATETFDKRKKALFNGFKDNGIIAESDFLDDDKLIAWITRAFQRANLSVTPNDALSIVSRCDSSMRQISSEVNKIILYCQGMEQSSVSAEMIEQLCPPDLKGSVFNITDAVGSGDAKTALSILDNLIIMKEPAIKIRFMLMRHLKQLICARDLGSKDAVMSRLKVQSFVADKLIRQSRRFSLDQLTKLFIECSRQDTEIKYGNLDPRQSLESFIILACGNK